MNAERIDVLTIPHDGDTWRIVGHGATREDGKLYCHLASTTRFVRQRNGDRAVQIADWIDPALILACAMQREEVMRAALARISLTEQDTTTAAAAKVDEMGRVARAALARIGEN